MGYSEQYGKPQNMQLQLPYLDEKGERDVLEAYEWLRKNRGEYSYMVANAKRLHEHNGWVSANYLVNMVRNEHNVKVKNGYAPAFARIIEANVPSLRGAFKKHYSRSDGYMS